MDRDSSGSHGIHCEGGKHLEIKWGRNRELAIDCDTFSWLDFFTDGKCN